MRGERREGRRRRWMEWGWVVREVVRVERREVKRERGEEGVRGW